MEAQVDRIWCVVPGPASQPGRIYLGVASAAIFASDDGGATWELNRAL